MTTLAADFPTVQAGKTSTSDPFVYRIRDIVYQSAGLFYPENKFYFLEERCRRRMKSLGIGLFRDYFDVLSTAVRGEEELRNLFNEITVGETSFFRNQPQLDAFRRVVLPQLVTAKTRLCFPRLRVWSAGCSTGEEAYTLAMILLEEAAAALKGWTFEVAATDLNERSLARAREATYDAYALRNLPVYYQQKYFQAADDGRFRVKDEVKACVSFSRLNLLDNVRMVFMKGYDAIFCCNVLIYFDSASKRRTIQHFYNGLLQNGFFFLGHSESLYGVNDDFRLVHFPGATGYLKSAGRAQAGEAAAK